MESTTYRFQLPDGQVYGGESPDRIFAIYPDAVVTHRYHRDAAGNDTAELLEPPLRYEPADADADPDPAGGEGGSGLDDLTDGTTRDDGLDGDAAPVDDDDPFVARVQPFGAAGFFGGDEDGS